eukprot:c9829_g1_i2.p1 GENE.c9829_g1_i2~~c9829_g1_i2.p1  ORF type:complete len:326 (-),score=88.62 c9829_g1_i2:741-1637(-)
MANQAMALLMGARTEEPTPKSTDKYSTSYNASEVTSGLEHEISRLRAQANLTYRKDLLMLEQMGLKDGDRMLEIGCGPAFTAIRILQHFPTLEIVCVEMDDRLIAHANKEIPEDLKSRITIIHGIIETAELEKESFDFAFARFVLQHVPDAVTLAKKVFELLKPNGKFAAIDADDATAGYLEPVLPALAPLGSLMLVRQHRMGGDRTIGRRLGRVLLLASFEKIRMELLLNHIDEEGVDLSDFKGNLAPERFMPLLREGLMTKEEYDTAKSQVDTLFESQYPIIATISMVACGTKPSQ